LGQLPPPSQIDHIAQIPVGTHPSTSTNGVRPLPVSATTSIHPQLAYLSVPSSNTSGHPVPVVATTTSHPVGSSITSPATNQDLVFIGLGLPSISKKSSERIEAGNFVEMAELLPENLSLFSTTEAGQSTSKTQHHVVTNIFEWLQCFSTYIAIVSYKQPHRVSDLLGYQHLIIQASQDYEGDSWLGYDRRFRQQMAASPSNSWASTDSSLWNQFFSG